MAQKRTMLVRTEDVQSGMFVTELDRPWTETPFLLQGVLVQSDDEIAILKRFCSHVTIDLDRSVGLRLEIEPRSAPPSKPSWLERLFASFRRKRALGASWQTVEGSGQARPLGADGLYSKESTPPDAPLREDERIAAVAELKAFHAEVPRAARTLRDAEKLMKEVVTSVASGGQLRIDKADEVVVGIVDSVARNPNALLWLGRLQSADRAAYAHSLQAAIYLVTLGQHLGLPREDLQRLGLAGMMLDVGKLRVAKHILDKPGPLDPTETAAARAHVAHSLAILADVPDIHPLVKQAVERHHEREDGSGYPQGMAGERIGLYGRLAGIVDTFVAMTNRRPYAETMSMQDCLRLLYQWRGSLFHAPMVEHFIQAISVFPVGTLVELSSGEIAVVVAHNRVRRLKPRVLVLTGADHQRLPQPKPLDLLFANADQEGADLRIVRGLAPGAYGIDPTELFLQQNA